MDFNNYLIEAIGFLASIILIYSVAKVCDKKLIIYQTISNFLWIIHFSLLGAYEGALAGFFGVVRYFFVYKYNSNKAKIGFLSVFIGFTIWRGFYIDNIIEILPLVAIFIITYAILYQSKNKLTYYLYIGNFTFLFYAIYIESISATINYILMIIILTSRYLKLKKEA